MKIVLLTQDDPFYLCETTDDFIIKIESLKKHKLITAIITKPSPFGKKEKFWQKVKKTYSIFGIRFFIYYTFKFLYRKIVLRKSVIKTLKKHKIPVWELNNSINSSKSIDKLKELNPDIIVIIAGNQIIKKQVLDIPKFGIINAHSSLLPFYKGLMPTFWTLRNNEKRTGVTVFKLTEGIDDGPIINSREIAISPQISQSKLISVSKLVANDLIIEALDLVNKPENFKENKGGSYYKFPNRNDVKIFYENKKKFF
jgi:methionyl-tRNA formyltransferase